MSPPVMRCLPETVPVLPIIPERSTQVSKSDKTSVTAEAVPTLGDLDRALQAGADHAASAQERVEPGVAAHALRGGGQAVPHRSRAIGALRQRGRFASDGCR